MLIQKQVTCPRCAGKKVLDETCCNCGEPVSDWTKVGNSFQNLPCGHFADTRGGQMCGRCEGTGQVAQWEQIVDDAVIVKRYALPALAQILEEAMAKHLPGQVKAVAELLRDLASDGPPSRYAESVLACVEMRNRVAANDTASEEAENLVPIV